MFHVVPGDGGDDNGDGNGDGESLKILIIGCALTSGVLFMIFIIFHIKKATDKLYEPVEKPQLVNSNPAPEINASTSPQSRDGSQKKINSKFKLSKPRKLTDYIARLRFIKRKPKIEPIPEQTEYYDYNYMKSLIYRTFGKRK